jgi:hypothetical protein
MAALATVCPLEQLFLQMINGLCNKAYAGDAQLMNYIMLLAGGGPNRRVYDTILKIKEDDSLLTGNSIATNFTNHNPSDGSFDLEYKTILHKGLYLPYMNSMEVDLTSGKTELKHLFDHALFIRGVDLKSQGHDDCMRFLTEPVPGAATINGYHADLSSRLFPFIAFNWEPSFSSEKGTSQVKVSSRSKPFNSIFKATSSVYKESSGLSYSNSAIETKIDGALALLKEVSLHSNPKTKSLYTDRANARNMFKIAVDIFESEYSSRVVTYKKVIQDTIYNMSLPDLFDEKNYKVDPNNPAHRCAAKPIYDDYWGETHRNQDALESKRPDIPQLAEALAFAEIALKHELTNSIALQEQRLGPIWMKKSPGGSQQSLSMASDAHGWGAVPLMYYNTMRFAASGAAVLEFVNRLKVTNSVSGKNLFNNSLLHLCSEFPNIPLGEDDSGHGGKGQQATLISGKFDAPMVIGNIKKGNLSEYWNGSGTWGEAASIDALKGRELNRGNLSSSICKILGCKTPTPNDQSIVDFDSSGKLINLIDSPKNIG